MVILNLTLGKRTQNLVRAIACRFDPGSRHHLLFLQIWRCFCHSFSSIYPNCSITEHTKITRNPSQLKPVEVEDQEIIPYPPSYYQSPEEDTVDLIELLQTLGNWKWMIMDLVVIGTLGSYAVTTFLPKVYKTSV